VARYRDEGAHGLDNRSSAPTGRLKRIPLETLELIDRWRRDHRWSARRIHHELTQLGHHCRLRTVSRWLKRLGINRRRDLDPTGENNRKVGTNTARFPRHMLHMDVKKVGKMSLPGPFTSALENTS
jgi:transposase